MFKIDMLFIHVPRFTFTATCYRINHRVNIKPCILCVRACADGSPAAHRACHDGNHEALQILMSYDASVSQPDSQGRYAIHWACACRDRECLRVSDVTAGLAGPLRHPLGVCLS